PAEGTVSPTSVTFTASNWNVPRTVTVTGVDDLVVDGDVAYTIVTAPAISSDPVYNGRNAADVAVTNLDNDVPGVDLLPTAFTAPTAPLVGNPATAQVSWTVKNQGPAPGSVTQWTDRVIFSEDTVVGNADDVTLLDVRHLGALDHDQTYSEQRTVTLPANR